MNRRSYFFLFLLGAGLSSLTVLSGRIAGYMDADYYLMGGVRLAAGLGFSEQILWNYLDQPIDLPHASHTYWMPMASILTAAGIRVAPGLAPALAGRIVFVLLSGLVPVVTALLATRFTTALWQIRSAGLLACLPGFYLPFMAAHDTFAFMMVAGGAFLMVAFYRSDLPGAGKPQDWRGLVLGLIAGLMHLARADGLLWLGIAGLASLWNSSRAEQTHRIAAVLRAAGLLLLGYLLIMGPWMYRNLAVTGSLLASGGTRALWLLDYDSLFAFPVEHLTGENWLASGLSAILTARWQALLTNLQTAVAIQAQIFLAPLVLWGAWVERKNPLVRLGLTAWTLILFVMTVLFPFAGARGGFFHSGAALQPLFWILAVVGFGRFLTWGRAARGWRLSQARPIFLGALILFAGLLSLGLLLSREPAPPVSLYAHVEEALAAQQLDSGERVMVNNPPGYYLASGRPAVVIPSGGLEAILAVSAQYQARYLVLEPLQGLPEIYDDPHGYDSLRLLDSVGSALIFEITND
jgi:hypothetical protein